MIQHAPGATNALHLARVIDNQDSDGRGRVQVELQNTRMELWAAVMVASAGPGYGTSLLPKIDEMVVVAFISPEQPVVLGAVWSGGDSQPEDAAPVEERYCIRSPSGLQLLFDDQDGPKIEVTTPNGYQIRITDAEGGEVLVERGSESVRLHSGGVEVNSSAEVKVSASQVKIEASMLQVDAGMSKFSGVVRCDTLSTNSVISTSYTPGAGNIW